MKGSSRPGVVPWAHVFELRYNQDSSKPLHVQVVDVGPGVQNVRQGDELFLHDITSDDISLKRSMSSLTATGRRLSASQDSRLGSNDDVEILLPRHYGAGFILCQRYPLSHCFKSVREIIDALPAVSRIFYPVDGLYVGSEEVKPMERLEILQQITDPLKGTDMLCVRSMKTEAKILLPADLRAQFVQLSNDCFKCGPEGIKAFECVMSWKPGQPPFQVKLCPPRKEEKPANLKVPKQSKPKKDKKDRKKKHASWGDFENLKLSDYQSESGDRRLIPESWRYSHMYMRPFQRIRVQNVMFNARDFFLPENAKLMIKVLSDDPPPALETSPSNQNRSRISSSSGIFSGPLHMLPPDMVSRTKGPLLLLVTEGEMTTSLRQQLKISPGSRLAIHRAQHSEKILMECERGQKFIVDLSYAGLFTRVVPASSESNFPIKDVFNSTLPCQVCVTKEDRSLGYDQLSRRTSLTVIQTLTDTTLYVEAVGADGLVLSEKPFEIPLCRTNLSVKVIDGKSAELSGCVSMQRLKLLPAVEFITKSQMEILMRPPRTEICDVESSREAASQEYSFESHRMHPNQGVEDIYRIPSKAKHDAGNATLPPPRPPKSPNIAHQKLPTQQQIKTNYGPPDLPPKPVRYRDMPVGHSYNPNRNSNNNQGTVISPLAQTITERNPFQQTKRETAYGVEPIVPERHHSPFYAFESPGYTRQGNSHSNSENANPMTTAPTLPPKPRNSSFQNMHSHFNPNGFNVEEKLVTIEEHPAEPQKVHGDFGIYGQSLQPKQEIDFKGALIRARHSKHGSSIVNPNYADRLGEEICDPTFVRGPENSGDSPYDEPDYEFAENVPKIESSSDDDDYETVGNTNLFQVPSYR